MLPNLGKRMKNGQILGNLGKDEHGKLGGFTLHPGLIQFSIMAGFVHYAIP